MEPTAEVRVRLTSKTKKVGRCRRCCVRTTQLQREFGGWPHPAFKGISEADQQQFFKSIKHISSLQDMKAIAHETLERYNTAK